MTAGNSKSAVAEEVELMLGNLQDPRDIARALGVKMESVARALQRAGRIEAAEVFIATMRREAMALHPPRGWSSK